MWCMASDQFSSSLRVEVHFFQEEIGCFTNSLPHARLSPPLPLAERLERLPQLPLVYLLHPHRVEVLIVQQRQVIRLRRAKVLAKRSLKLRGAFGGSAHATRAQKGRAMG